jgi:hypothetical protein
VHQRPIIERWSWAGMRPRCRRHLATMLESCTEQHAGAAWA